MFHTIDSVMDEVYAWARLRLERARELLEKTRRGSTQAVSEMSLDEYRKAAEAWVRLGEAMMAPEQITWRLAKVQAMQRHLKGREEAGVPWIACFRAACTEVRTMNPPATERAALPVAAAGPRPLPLHRRIVTYLGRARASGFSSTGR